MVHAKQACLDLLTVQAQCVAANQEAFRCRDSAGERQAIDYQSSVPCCLSVVCSVVTIMAPSTPGSDQTSHSHSRNPSEFGAIESFKHTFLDSDVSRRCLMPSHLRTSVSNPLHLWLPDHWPRTWAHLISCEIWMSLIER